MDIDPPVAVTPHSSISSLPQPNSVTPNHTALSSSVIAPPSRSLRARPSHPLPPATPSIGSSSRQPTKNELAHIRQRLSSEAIAEKREKLIAGKEKEFKEVVEGHDTAVREKFHLERFVTLLDGWDPEHAKTDNSPVFLEWKDARHNLLNLLPPEPSLASGPSSRSRPSAGRVSLPSRTTRRKAHEQSELIAHVVAPPPSVHVTPASAKGKGKAVEGAAEGTPVSGKGKGKAWEVKEEVEEEDPLPVTKGKGKGRAGSTKVEAEMPPPPAPGKKGKDSRRATINTAVNGSKSGHLEVVVELDAPTGGKKRGRMSLPNLPAAKKLKASNRAAEEDSATASPAVQTPTSERPLSPTPLPPPTPLPSLADVPFPPAPPRPRQRITGPRQIIYTEPSQQPSAPPKHGGDISQILESYIHINDTGAQPDIAALEARAKREGYLRARVTYLQRNGRMQRLTDEAEASSLVSSTKPQKLPPRKTDFQDSLMAHMVQVRNAMLNEGKQKPVICRKVARMVQAYWDKIEGKDERERQAEEKERKRKAKEMVKGLRKRWGLAVKIVRVKILEAQKAEQDRLGKEHLQNMLQRSTGLLEAQVQGDSDEEDEDDDDEEDEDIFGEDSDGTEAVSAAELSEGEERELEEDDEHDGLDSSMPPTSDAPEPMAVGASDQEDEEEDEDDEDEDEDEEGDEEDEEAEEEERRDRSSDLRFLVSEDAAADTQAVFEEGQEETSVAAASDAPAIDVVDDGEAAVQRLLEDVVSTPADAPAVPSPSDNALVATTPTTHANGHTSPAQSASTPVTRPRRARKPPAVALPTDEDPDANDVEFQAPSSDLDEQDAELDEEMEELADEREAEQVGEGDSEDEGLLADADVPIEELLKRYGYPVPEATESDDVDEVEVADEAGEAEKAEASQDTATDAAAQNIPQTNGHLPISPPADQSLTDEALADASPVPRQLVMDGKRERKKRTLWSPDDEGPQQLASQRKRVKVVQKRKAGGAQAVLDVEMNGGEEDGEKEEEEEEEEEQEEEEEESEEESEDEIEEDEEEGKAAAGDEKGEEDSGPRVRPPFLLRGTLRPYQQAGLEWLASLYANKMNGILADEMGLGKTIQTISLLGHLACDKGVWGQHLIIVPTSVILNWEMEFKKFLPGMKVLSYYGNQKERKEKRTGWNTENAWQVCITSYQIVLADQHIFRRKSWCYMILDEAHNIKNFRSQRWQTLLGFKAQRRLLLTGTPLQNNLMELWSLLYFLMPGGIGADASAVVGFANHKEFMEWFSNPMDQAVESGDAMDEETLATVAKLHTLLRPFILRRLKAEVETQLPGKFEHVVYCRLSKRQRFLYDEFMSRASTLAALSTGGYLGVMNTLMQLRKVCNHPDLFEIRPVRTSFAMESVAKEFQPAELLVRRRMLERDDEKRVDLLEMGFSVTHQEDMSGWVAKGRRELDASALFPQPVTTTKRGRQPAPPPKDTLTVEGWLKYRAWQEEEAAKARWVALGIANRRRCTERPVYGSTLLEMLGGTPNLLLPTDVRPRKGEMMMDFRPPASALVLSLPERARTLEPIIDRFAVMPPNVVAPMLPVFALPGLEPTSHPSFVEPDFDTLHRSTVKLQIAFPDASLLQYDCGKLQKLYEMLRDLKAGGHRVLIFTQMTRVLDILEMFLSYNGHRYLRLDGSTKIEDRQIITERFNADPRIFVFIASSRSGGVGINLTGADTVFFYDSDWNPSMDRQCMDRAHRIGQTREVHIYRFVSSHTVEENMLRKAEQKRMLDRMVIQEGGFNNDWWGRVGWKDMFGEVPGMGAGDAPADGTRATITPLAPGEDGAETDREPSGIVDIPLSPTPGAEPLTVTRPRMGEERALAHALAAVEDEEDAQAAEKAQRENEGDFEDFEEGRVAGRAVQKSATPAVMSTPQAVGEGGDGEDVEEEEDEDEDGIGGVEEYMLKWVEEDWDWFVSFRP